MISIKKLIRSHRARQQRLEVREMFEGAALTDFVRAILLDLDGGYIDVPESLSRYARRDARMLEPCESFDDVGAFKQRLKDATYKTEKHDWKLDDVLDTELLAEHQKRYADAASEFGVKTKFVFYQDYKEPYCSVVTLNLKEVGKEWTKQQLKDFFNKFVYEIQDTINPNIWKGVPVHRYGQPIYPVGSQRNPH